MASERRVLILTGTSRGIGEYLARHYLESGWSVAGCSRGDAALEHENYFHRTVDVTDEKAVGAWVREAEKELGPIDAVINNAGAGRMNHALLTPGSTVDRLMELNFKGTFLVSREAGRRMQKRKQGRIVNFSTIAVGLALEGEAVYVASKSAVEAFSKVLARELAPKGITVNVVAPPPIPTKLIAGIPEDKMDALLAKTAFGKLGTPEDVANVTDFFLSPASAMVTGQVLTIGGIG